MQIIPQPAAGDPYALDVQGVGSSGYGARILQGLTVSGGIAVSGGITFAGALVITSAAAAALAVGRQGATNPAFQVDASAANSVTGVKVTAGASGAGVKLAPISSAAAENLDIDSLGTGTVQIGANNSQGVTVFLGVANGLRVGRAAANPAFQVVGAVANSATGVRVTPAAAAGGVAVDVISSGAAEALTIDAKGTGAITVGGTSTGAVNLGSAAGNRVNFQRTAVALGGGAAATNGTIGGAGPTAAGQAAWLEIQVGGVTRWVPVWA